MRQMCEVLSLMKKAGNILYIAVSVVENDYFYQNRKAHSMVLLSSLALSKMTLLRINDKKRVK